MKKACFKKTGKEVTLFVQDKETTLVDVYNSLAELCEDIEDVSEPLIKDEKIRKAVRAWAEANSITEIVVFDCNNGTCLKVNELGSAENGGRATIMFETNEKIDTDRRYTIEELCGSEE